MYEEEFEEGLSKLDPEFAAMWRDMHQKAIHSDEIDSQIAIANDEAHRRMWAEEKKAKEGRSKQELMDMLDKAVKDSKEYGG